MNIRHLLLGIFVACIAASCTKETTNNNEVIAATFFNTSYGADPQQKMDVYLPAGRTASNTKVIIMLHGGAWTAGFGTRADVAAYVDTLRSRLPGYAIFNIDYRLFSLPTTNPFPAQELDTKSAVEFIYNKRNDYLISDKFVLIGVSAGAHLSLLHAYKYPAPVKIKAVVDFFGPTDMNDLYNTPGLVAQTNIASIVGATPVSNADLYLQSSPVSFATAASACPTIILQGSADPLVNAIRQSGALRDKLQTAAVPVQYVEYPGKGHGDDWSSADFFDAFNKVQAFLSLYNP